ncbi:hypothetical protein GCM10025880_58770 [Methylorubrum aminovorans]|nr:hypothetical protein GCM10025880_58770 [Methylorubrum aminovorans]
MRRGSAVEAKAPPPQAAGERDEGHEDDARRAEMTKAGEVIEPVRVDQGARLRKLLWSTVVIEHDHVEAEGRCGGQRFVAGSAAIDADEQARPLLAQSRDGADIRAVAFRDAVGDVDAHLDAERPQIICEERCARRAVHVVIAEDRHRLVGSYGMSEAIDRRLHIHEHGGVRHQVAQARGQISLGLGRPYAAPDEDAGEQIRQAVGLGHGCRQSLKTGIPAPLAPGPPEHRCGDVEEGARQIEGRGEGHGSGHGATIAASDGKNCALQTTAGRTIARPPRI